MAPPGWRIRTGARRRSSPAGTGVVVAIGVANSCSYSTGSMRRYSTAMSAAHRVAPHRAVEPGRVGGQDELGDLRAEAAHHLGARTSSAARCERGHVQRLAVGQLGRAEVARPAPCRPPVRRPGWPARNARAAPRTASPDRGGRASPGCGGVPVAAGGGRAPLGRGVVDDAADTADRSAGGGDLRGQVLQALVDQVNDRQRRLEVGAVDGQAGRGLRAVVAAATRSCPKRPAAARRSRRAGLQQFVQVLDGPERGEFGRRDAVAQAASR